MERATLAEIGKSLGRKALREIVALPNRTLYRPLMRVLTEFTAHYQAERNHQGKGNLILFPESLGTPGTIECHERLRGLVKYYARAA
jgi:hypothetical protein